jgi:hypothetical protein
MKKFSQFLKEEVDLKGNKGIPDDFMSKSEEQAKRNLGSQNLGSEISQLISKSNRLMTNGLNRDQIEERYTKLENLAKKVIMDEYGDIIEASLKPVELQIKLIRPNQSVLGELPKLSQVPTESNERPEYQNEDEDYNDVDSDVESDEANQTDDTDNSEQTQSTDDDFFSFFDDETDYEKQEEENPEEVEELTNKDVAMSIDKKKILNMITQGEGKATKEIIKYSEIIENGLSEIFGDDSYKELLDVWKKTADVAHKLDWSFDDSQKASMMKNAPGGLAGAVDVTWESLNSKFKNISLLTENTDFNKIVIRAYGIDFPMLLHETIKGIYMLLQSSAIKKDKELATEIKSATSSFKDESQDFKYGVVAQGMFRDFINACKDSNKYKQMRARVFALLAIDKGNGGKFTDKEFLDITKEIFSLFDKVEVNGKIEFRINKFRFETSRVKQIIEEIIADIVRTEDEYREELNRWEMEQRFKQSPKPETKEDEKESEIDSLIRKTKEKEEDYSQLSKRDLQELIDAALDAGDYEEVKKLSQYLKENRFYTKNKFRKNDF